MAREILDIERLRETSPGFKRKLFEVSDAQGLDPSYLAAVIAFESGFNPQARNPDSSASGLIQFMRDTAPLLGTTIEEIRQMDEVEQMDLVNRYFQRVQDHFGKVRRESPEDHYMAVLAPAKIKSSNSSAVYSRPSNPYSANKTLDWDKDGTITKTEASKVVLQKIRDAEGRPRLLVDETTGEIVGDTPPGFHTVPHQLARSDQAILLLGGAAVGFILLEKALPHLRRRFPALRAAGRR